MSATHTTNLGLNKPNRQDYVSVVTDINDNMDILDSKIGAVPSGETVEGQIGAKVSTTRKINNKALSSDVTIMGSDIPMNSLDNTKLDVAVGDLKSAFDYSLLMDVSTIAEWDSSSDFINGYVDTSGQQHGSTNWRMAGTSTNLLPNRYYKYSGRLYGNTAGFIIFDKNGNVVQTITGDTTDNPPKTEVIFRTTNDEGLHAYYSFYFGTDGFPNNMKIENLVFRTPEIDDFEIEQIKLLANSQNLINLYDPYVSGFSNLYYDSEGSHSSGSWRTNGQHIPLVPGQSYVYKGRLYNQAVAGLPIFNSNNGQIGIITVDNYTEKLVDSFIFTAPANSSFCLISCYVGADSDGTIPSDLGIYSFEKKIDVPTYPILSSEMKLMDSYKGFIRVETVNIGKSFPCSEGAVYKFIAKTNRTFNADCNILIADENGANRKTFIRNVDKTLLSTGYEFEIKAQFPSMSVMLYFFNSTDNINDSPYFDLNMYSNDSLRMRKTDEYAKQLSESNYISSLAASKANLLIAELENTVRSSLKFDVCIIGAGSAGVNAAYALSKRGYRVCIIDKGENIGGTFANGWINCCAATPDTPLFREIAKEMLYEGTARFVNTYYQAIVPGKYTLEYSRSLIRTQFRAHGDSELCITFDVEAYRKKLISKLSGATIMLSTTFDSCSVEDNNIISINVNDKNGDSITIYADVFIDSSADDVLIRGAGVDCFRGSDSSTRYYSEYGFTESHAGNSSDPDSLNPPTLMFRTKYGEEDISGIDISGLDYYLNPYYYGDGSEKYFYNNSSSFLSEEYATDVISRGADYVIEQITPKILPYWAYVKTNGLSEYANLGLRKQAFDSIAPMLAIRETYRAKTERLLNENDLYVQVNKSYTANSVLDLPIAMGNHPVDIHGNAGVDVTYINEHRKPYFVKYGCLVPVGLNNTLVASRGAGFTHIGAASFRLNKDMMQIGWCAGNAAAYMIENNLPNSRNVNKDKLHQMMGFETLLDEVIEIIT